MTRYALLPISRHASGDAARRGGLSRSELVHWRMGDASRPPAASAVGGYRDHPRPGRVNNGEAHGKWVKNRNISL